MQRPERIVKWPTRALWRALYGTVVSTAGSLDGIKGDDAELSTLAGRFPPARYW